MAGTPAPISVGRKRHMRQGIVLNAVGAVFLLTVGVAKGIGLVIILGVVEALFCAFVLWSYRRTPVIPDSP